MMCGNRFGPALAVACVITTSTSGSPACASGAKAWEEGREALAEYHELRALPLIRQAAEAGHRQAQEVLGLMLLHGHSVFGRHFPLDSTEGRCWIARASSAGSDAACDRAAREADADASAKSGTTADPRGTVAPVSGSNRPAP